MRIDVYDYKGDKKEKVNLGVKGDVENVNEDLLTQYVRVYSANQRQGTSKVKTRSEVRGGGKKPWKQKGTGRARAGSIRSPVWVGGGVAHGPQPKDWSMRFNKKMKKRAFFDAIMLKLNNNNVYVFEYPNKDKKPSTKMARVFLDKVVHEDGKTLIVHENTSLLYKSFRNIRGVVIKEIEKTSTYDVLCADHMIVEKKALSSLASRIKS